MPKAYSEDLRERVVHAAETGRERPAAVACRFRVGISTVYNWLAQARHEGRRTAKPAAGGPRPLIDEQGIEVLRRLLRDERLPTLDTCVERFAAETGTRVSRPTMCRALQRLGAGFRRRNRRSPRRPADAPAADDAASPRSTPAPLATDAAGPAGAPPQPE